MMRVTKYDGGDVRRVLAGMMRDQTVCSRIETQWTREGLFGVSWADLVAGLIIDYFRKYGTPPKDQMVGVFERWATETTADDKTIESIERFLQDIEAEGPAAGSDETSEYVLDEAARVFGKARIEQAIEAAKLDLEGGEIEAAQERFEGLRRVNLGPGSYIVPADDPDVWERAFDRSRNRELVPYRGDLGRFIGDAMTRGALYSFMAPDKTGKTAWLLDFIYRACRARNNVAFFDAGDSREEEILMRLAMRTTGLPEYAGSYDLVTDWGDDGPVYKEIDLPAVDAVTAFRQFRGICKDEYAFRMSCHDNSSLSVPDIDAILANWDREGWRPDVVVVDYADILAPPKGVKDPLDQIDHTWRHLRRLSQRRHVLVMTATQSSALVYGKEDGLLGRKHFSGRKTKFAHVNGMLGINVSFEEKVAGMARLNWLVRRRGRYDERDFCQVAGSLSIGRPVILSKWGPRKDSETSKDPS